MIKEPAGVTESVFTTRVSHRRAEGARDDDGTPDATSLGRRIVIGATGGVVATVVMTAFRLPISRSLPPTDEFWRRYVRRDSGRSDVVPAIGLHLLYGALAGVAYVLAVPPTARAAEAVGELAGVVSAVAYGLLLSAFGERVVLGMVLGQDLSDDERLVFHLGHVVYGITLGTWVGSRATND